MTGNHRPGDSRVTGHRVVEVDGELVALVDEMRTGIQTSDGVHVGGTDATAGVSVISASALRVVSASDMDITGATDVTTALAAILTAEAYTREVVLTPGTYLIGSLTIPAGTRLTGYGAMLKSAAARPSNTAALNIAATGQDITLRGLTVDGNAANQTASAVAGLWVKGKSGADYSHNIRVEDCYFHDIKYAGVQLDGGTTDVRFENCRTYNTGGWGFVLLYSANTTDQQARIFFDGCEVDTTGNGTSAFGITTSVNSGTPVSFTGDTTSGSYVITNIPDTSSLVQYQLVTGTGMPSNARIQSIDSASQITLNLPASATGTGVALTATTQIASPGATDVMWSDCFVRRSDHDGVAAYSPNNVNLTIDGLTVDNTGWTPSAGGSGGHICHLGGRNLSIASATGKNINGAAIVISNQPNDGPVAGQNFVISDCIVDATTFSANTVNTHGILIQNYDKGVISNCQIDSAYASGIYINGNTGTVTHTCKSIAIEGCAITNCGENGIYAIACQNLSVSGCTITGNGVTVTNPGVRWADVTRSAITGCDCDGNTLDGVRLTGTCLDIAVGACSLSGNGGWGIQSANSCNRVSVTGCAFPNNSSGTISLVGVNNAVAGNTNVTPPTIASAATITPSQVSDHMIVSGTTGITSITANTAGRRITIRFSGVLTVTDGSNLKLNGNLTSAADTTLSLVCDGTNWIELARSVN